MGRPHGSAASTFELDRLRSAQELDEYGLGCSARCAVLLSLVIQDRLLLQRGFCVSVGWCAFVGAVRGTIRQLPGTDQHGFKNDTFRGWCSGGLDCFFVGCLSEGSHEDHKFSA